MRSFINQERAVVTVRLRQFLSMFTRLSMSLRPAIMRQTPDYIQGWRFGNSQIKLTGQAGPDN